MIVGIAIKLAARKNTTKTVLLILSYVAFGISILIFLSFIFAFSVCKHYDVHSTYNQYDIDKITTGTVYFNYGEQKINNIENSVIIEKPNREYNNIVIVEDKTYSVYWLLGEIKCLVTKYHIYLSEDVYYNYKEKNIYEK